MMRRWGENRRGDQLLGRLTWKMTVRIQAHLWKGSNLGRKNLVRITRSYSTASPAEVGTSVLSQNKQVEGCVEGIGPSEPHSTHPQISAMNRRKQTSM